MSTIIETMARAIHDTMFVDAYDTNPVVEQEMAKQQARAALLSVKPSDISDAMLDAYWAIRDRDPNDGETSRERDARALAAAIAAGA